MSANLVRGRMVALAAIGFALATAPAAAARVYPWLPEDGRTRQALADRIAPPAGFARVPVAAGSFADWLRYLPLAPARTPVRYFNGRLKPNQDIHAAVVDLDVGRRDLQQCADAVMRLRAEYLYSTGRRAAVAFNFTSGDRVPFSRWAAGWRPRVKGNRVRWRRNGSRGADHASFRKYLTTIFTYAGSYSLAREMMPVRDPNAIRIGDVFIQGGFPGHAVIVVDLAVGADGAKRFLLAQSYMPAQSLHILRNPRDPKGSPWFAVPRGAKFVTPEWTFETRHLRRFR